MDKEILDLFVEESNQVLQELTTTVEKLEMAHGAFPTELMSEFSQKIDRIMGAAKTMNMTEPDHKGFQRIGKIAELCKMMGYKASEQKKPQLLPLFAAFWSDVIEVTQNLLLAIEDHDKTEKIAQSFSAVLQKRLEWLLAKVDVKSAAKSHEERAKEAKELLSSLGL